MSSTGTTSPLQTLFAQLGNELISDAFSNASGLLNAFFTNVKGNPDPQNVVAQGAILAASAMLQLPNLEKEAIGQVADTGLALLAQIKRPVIKV